MGLGHTREIQAGLDPPWLGPPDVLRADILDLTSFSISISGPTPFNATVVIWPTYSLVTLLKGTYIRHRS
jgi:hypothetical protein